MNYANIYIIGFSITGYGDKSSTGKYIETMLRDRGWNGAVHEISYGGLSIDGLSALIPDVLDKMHGDSLVMLELATSFFSIQKYQYHDALPYLEFISKIIKRHSKIKKAAFLNLFRSDLEDNDCVMQAISSCSQAYDIPIIDLRPRLKEYSISGRYLTTDGVHPEEDTRRLMAKLITEELLTIDSAACSKPVIQQTHDEKGFEFNYFDIVSCNSDLEKYSYSSRGKSLHAIHLQPHNVISISLAAPTFINGIYFLYGPETGFVDVEIDESRQLRLPTFDEVSYYRRVGYRPIMQEGSLLKILAPHDTRDVHLLKPSTLTTYSRREFICGLNLRTNVR